MSEIRANIHNQLTFFLSLIRRLGRTLIPGILLDVKFGACTVVVDHTLPYGVQQSSMLLSRSALGQHSNLPGYICIMFKYMAPNPSEKEDILKHRGGRPSPGMGPCQSSRRAGLLGCPPGNFMYVEALRAATLPPFRQSRRAWYTSPRVSHQAYQAPEGQPETTRPGLLQWFGLFHPGGRIHQKKRPDESGR